MATYVSCKAAHGVRHVVWQACTARPPFPLQAGSAPARPPAIFLRQLGRPSATRGARRKRVWELSAAKGMATHLDVEGV
jgi:hypothetical protein